MVYDSETESDDNISCLAVGGLRKRKGKWSMVERENRRSNKTRKRKKLLSSTNTVAKPFKSKANVDRG